MNDERMFMKRIDENGVEQEYEILATFESTETNKSYMIFTDNSEDDEGNSRAEAACYEYNDGEFKLYDIETEKEMKIVETVFNELQAELRKSMDDGE